MPPHTPRQRKQKTAIGTLTQTGLTLPGARVVGHRKWIPPAPGRHPYVQLKLMSCICAHQQLRRDECASIADKTGTHSWMINREFSDHPPHCVSLEIGSAGPVFTCLQGNIICTSRKQTKLSGRRIAKLNTVANYQKCFSLNTHCRLCQHRRARKTWHTLQEASGQSLFFSLVKRDKGPVYLVFLVLVGDLQRVHGLDHGLHGGEDVLVDQPDEAPPVLLRVPAAMDNPHLFDERALPTLASSWQPNRRRVTLCRHPGLYNPNDFQIRISKNTAHTYTKTSRHNSTKFGGRVRRGQRKSPLNLRADVNHEADPGNYIRFCCVLLAQPL